MATAEDSLTRSLQAKLSFSDPQHSNLEMITVSIFINITEY